MKEKWERQVDREEINKSSTHFEKLTFKPEQIEKPWEISGWESCGILRFHIQTEIETSSEYVINGSREVVDGALMCVENN